MLQIAPPRTEAPVQGIEIPTSAAGMGGIREVVAFIRRAQRIVALFGGVPLSTTAGVDEFWFYGSSVIVWRAAGVVVASPTKRGCDRDRAALPRRDARGAGAPREP